MTEVDIESFKTNVEAKYKGIFSLCIQTHSDHTYQSKAAANSFDIDLRNYMQSINEKRENAKNVCQQWFDS